MRALFLESPDHTLRHAALLRTVQSDEFLSQAAARQVELSARLRHRCLALDDLQHQLNAIRLNSKLSAKHCYKPSSCHQLPAISKPSIGQG